MKPARFSFATLIAFAFLGSASCQLAYEVDVSSRNGHIIFEPYRPGWFGRRESARVNWLEVREASETGPQVWEIRSIDYNGQVAEEIPYGDAPAGFGEIVRDRPLKAGQEYHVSLMALGGSAHRSFVVVPLSQSNDEPQE